MTREEFESTFLTHYQYLCGLAERRVPSLGVDLVHQAYTNIVENQTYKNGKLRYAKQWVVFKVRREITRYKHKVYMEGLVTRPLRDEDIDEY